MTRPLAALLAAAVALAACGGGGGASPGPAGAATPGPGEFANPVLDRDFPDPGVLLVDGTYYAYATEGGGRHIQLARSTDLVTWEYLGEALDRLPVWTSGSTWAPEVIETSAGYVMYYTARDPDLPRPNGEGFSTCLSVAVAEAPEGPFVDASREGFVCQNDLGGSIDPYPFRDADGTLYLVWKNDGNCCGITTRFWAQELTPDGLSLVGEPVDLGLSNDALWERQGNSRIEAPTLLLHDGTYYAFFSGSDHSTSQYAVGYATADSVLGPYTDASENPILHTPEERGQPPFGPGGQAIVADDDGELWIVYHAWNAGFSRREMWIDELVLENGTAVIRGPDAGPQPVP